jgi:hypothetical protein
MGLRLLLLLFFASVCQSSSLGEELARLSRKHHPQVTPTLEELEAIVSDMARQAVVEFNKTHIDIDWYDLPVLSGQTNDTKKELAKKFVEVFREKYNDDMAVAYIDKTLSVCWAADKSCYYMSPVNFEFIDRITCGGGGCVIPCSN